MNSFTAPQLKTIRDLAERYYDVTFPKNEKLIVEEFRIDARERYVEAIIQGLTDPDVWGY